MNITLRKLAMLEKNFEKKAEEAKIMGYTTTPYNADFHRRISDLMDRVRVV